MILTQKISLFAFSLNDGTKPVEKLTNTQKNFVIK